MVPSPARVTGVHARWWQAGQNSLGGIASSPHLPQRTAVSVPSRARSKKLFTVTTGVSLTAEQADEDGGEIAAEGVGEADAGAVDLARAGLAAELRRDLGDL